MARGSHSVLEGEHVPAHTLEHQSPREVTFVRVLEEGGGTHQTLAYGSSPSRPEMNRNAYREAHHSDRLRQAVTALA